MRFARRTCLNWLLFSAVWAAGCSSGTPDQGSTGKSAATKSSSGASPAEVAPAAPSAHRSEFSTNAALRDPFFPNVKRQPEAVAQSSAQPLDVERQLRAGFLGIFGAGRDRVALINNVMLEAGRTASIPIRSGGQIKEITVKVREVFPTAVVLEVEGDGRAITISTAKP